jgi:hypothetical protein
LPADDVARLRAHAKAALLRSDEFQRLLRALRQWCCKRVAAGRSAHSLP